MFAFLLIFGVITLATVQEKQQSTSLEKPLLYPILLIVLSILFVYPPFLIFVLYFYAFYYSINQAKRTEKDIKRKICILLLPLIAITAILILAKIALSPFVPALSLSARSYYQFPVEFLYDNVNGIMMISTFILAVNNFFKLKPKNITLSCSIFYLILFSSLILSTQEPLFIFLCYTLPSRSLIIASSLSWVIFSQYAHLFYTKIWKEFQIISNITFKMKCVRTTRKIQLNQKLLFDILIVSNIISLFAPTLFAHIPLNNNVKFGWFLSQSPSFDDDFKALTWIDANVSPEDLILNDLSQFSRYLLSLSFKNVVFSNPSFGNDLKEVWSIWKRPEDFYLVWSLVDKYEIKYVLSTSEGGYLDIWEGGYKTKPRSPSKYVEIFDCYPMFIPVFKSGNTRVYRVLPLNLQSVSIIFDDYRDSLWTTRAWGTGNIGSPIIHVNAINKKEGENSLQITVKNGSHIAWSIDYNIYFNKQDWSNADMIRFYWYGENSGDYLHVLIEAPDDKNVFVFRTLEDWKGWKQIGVLLKAFEVLKGEPSWQEVTKIRIGFWTGNINGTRYIDRIELFRLDVKENNT
jgi:hypothetical protein